MNLASHHEMPGWLKMLLGVVAAVAIYVGWVWSLASVTSGLAVGQDELRKAVLDLTTQMHDNAKQTQSLTIAIAEMNAHANDLTRRVSDIERDEKERALQEWRKK